jgi:hypothetical protein
MLAIITTWITSLFIFFSFGHFFVSLFSPHGKNNYIFADVFFLGFAFVGTILATLSLCIPLTGYVLLFLFIFSLFYFVYSSRKGQLSLLTDTWRKIKSLSLLYKIAIVLFFFVVALYSLLPPLHYDTALYHWQSMMWSESYPVVSGLANIHTRFGFNSNALLLHSVFSLQDIFGARIIGLNSLLLAVLFVWIIFKIRESTLIPQLALILFIFILVRFYDDAISSPATDLIPNIIVSYLLLRAVLDYRSLATVPLLYWILPIFCLTLKLSVAPICLFSLVVFVWQVKNKQYKTILTSLVIVCIVLIPWLTRNVILSGYLIYPIVDVFDVDWKVPTSVAKREILLMKTWTKVLDPDLEKVLNMPLIEWGKLWLLRNFNLSKTVIFVLGMAVISPLVILFTQRRKLLEKPYFVYPWVIAFVGVVFWFTTSPDIRYAFGYVIFTALAPFMLVKWEKVEKGFLNKTVPFLILLFASFFIGVSFNVIRITKGNLAYQSFLYEPNVTSFPEKRALAEFIPFKVDGITIYVPVSGDQCFDHPLPCTPPSVCLDCLELRGESIKDGFRTKAKE